MHFISSTANLPSATAMTWRQRFAKICTTYATRLSPGWRLPASYAPTNSYDSLQSRQTNCSGVLMGVVSSVRGPAVLLERALRRCHWTHAVTETYIVKLTYISMTGGPYW